MSGQFHTSRRQFLAGFAGLGMINTIPIRMCAKQILPQRRIPDKDESLPVIGIGSTKAVRQIPEAGTDPIENVIRMYLSYGGKVIDTSPRIAEIDEVFGRVLNIPEFRDELFVAAKVKVPGRDEGIAQFRQTQRLFHRQILDLVQVESLVDLETQWRNLKMFKEAGEVRYIGVTVSHEDLYEQLESFIKQESPDFIQLNYSVVEHTGEDRLLPLANDMGIAVLVNGPFMNGDYFNLVRGKRLPDWAREFECDSWAQFSLKYILANPAITCVLTETTNPDHMEENIHAAFGRLPDARQRQRMKNLVGTF